MSGRPAFVPRLAAATFAVIAVMAAGAAVAGSVELPSQVGGAYSVPVVSLKERRFAGTVRQRHDYSCGSAALATLLTNHYDQPVDEQAVFDAMLALGDAPRIRREGFSLLDMKRYLAAQGYEADGFEASLAALADAALPAIALVDEKGYHHFVVVKGVGGGRVLVGDPAGGTRAMPVEAFEARRVNAILFVIGNRREAARFNRETDWAAAPSAPLAGRFVGETAGALPRFGPSDF